MSWIESMRETLSNNTASYEVLKKIDANIELRRYDSLKWVTSTTNAKSSEFLQRQSSTLRPIFMYLGGSNSKSIRLNRVYLCTPFLYSFTNPLPERITAHTTCEITYKMYIPKDLRESLPNPLTNQMHFEDEEQVEYAVITFGGYPSIEEYFNYRDVLIARLGAESSKYDLVNFKIANYNSPMRFFARRNEVWLKKVAF